MSIKEKLTEALEKKRNDINSFIWKGEKIKTSEGFVQQTYKMVDCTVEQLNTFLERCETMLHNTQADVPGRYVLLDIINLQRNCCNTELFLRWLDNEKHIPKYMFLTSLSEFLKHNPDINPKLTAISAVVDGCPLEYSNILIETVINGCLDTLGQFSKKHLTLAFILKQGVWFSQHELDDMKNKGITDRMEYVKMKLNILNKPSLHKDLKITPKGLSLEQMQAMMTLSSKKYSELTTLQLEVLRNRILFSLENEVNFHIKQWESRKRQIKLVLKSKGVNID